MTYYHTLMLRTFSNPPPQTNTLFITFHNHSVLYTRQHRIYPSVDFILLSASWHANSLFWITFSFFITHSCGRLLEELRAARTSNVNIDINAIFKNISVVLLLIITLTLRIFHGPFKYRQFPHIADTM